MENEFTRGHTHGSDSISVSLPLFPLLYLYLCVSVLSVCFHFDRLNAQRNRWIASTKRLTLKFDRLLSLFLASPPSLALFLSLFSLSVSLCLSFSLSLSQR